MAGEHHGSSLNGHAEAIVQYLSFTPRVLQQLRTGDVFYADPSTFNDPLDCRPSVVTDLPIPELKDVLAQLIVRRVRSRANTSSIRRC
jgi:hypothetical protein